MPKLSDTMTVGTLIKWLKQEGDTLEPGDMIAEVETDKATMEIENFEEGILLKQYVKEGEQVPIGTKIAAIGEAGEIPDQKSVKKSKDEDDEESSQETRADKSVKISMPQADVKSNNGRIKASPVARKMAGEKGISLETIVGTGPGGRIVKVDVINAFEQQKERPSKVFEVEEDIEEESSAEEKPKKGGVEEKKWKAPEYAPMASQESHYEMITVTNMRRSIARHLSESKSNIPHFYLDIEIDAGPMLEIRKRLNEQLSGLTEEQGKISFTVNDFVLKATTEALRRVPEVNSSWDGEVIKRYSSVHLSFGVAIEEGLVTPVIRHAEQKGLRQMSSEAKGLIDRARNKKLKPEEMVGSTFTVTNLGMYGIESFYGIINPPNAGILSVGAIKKKPVISENDAVIMGQRMKIGFSGDHRVVDGAAGAQFLSHLKNLLESPMTMII